MDNKYNFINKKVMSYKIEFSLLNTRYIPSIYLDKAYDS